MSKEAKQTNKKPRKSKTDGLKQQVADLTSELQRERADFTNYKRRSETEKQQLLDHAKTNVVVQLLPMFDDLERALSHTPEDLNNHSWAKGVKKVHEQIQQRLKELGVKKIESQNQPFDPNFHEAVEFNDGNGKVDTVIQELRPGYMLDDGTVLRPAMVKVGKPDDKQGGKK